MVGGFARAQLGNSGKEKQGASSVLEALSTRGRCGKHTGTFTRAVFREMPLVKFFRVFFQTASEIQLIDIELLSRQVAEDRQFTLDLASDGGQSERKRKQRTNGGQVPGGQNRPGINLPYLTYVHSCLKYCSSYRERP